MSDMDDIESELSENGFQSLDLDTNYDFSQPEPADLGDVAPFEFGDPVDAYPETAADFAFDEPVDVSGSLGLDSDFGNPAEAFDQTLEEFADPLPPEQVESLKFDGPKETVAPAENLGMGASRPGNHPQKISLESREAAAAALGPMSYYKAKNLAKGRDVPGVDKSKLLPTGSDDLRGDGEPPAGDTQDVGGDDFPLDFEPPSGADADSGFGENQPGTTMNAAPTAADRETSANLDSASDALDMAADQFIDWVNSITTTLLRVSDSVSELKDRLDTQDPHDEW